DLLGAQDRLAAVQGCDPHQAVGSMIRRHDRHGIDPGGVDDAEAELAFRPALAGSREIGREISLEALFGKRPAVTEQAQTYLAVGDDRAATRRVALDAGERVR